MMRIKANQNFQVSNWKINFLVSPVKKIGEGYLAGQSRQIISYLAGLFNPLMNHVSYRIVISDYVIRFKQLIKLARACGVPVGRRSGGRLAMTLVATINVIIFFFSFFVKLQT